MQNIPQVLIFLINYMQNTLGLYSILILCLLVYSERRSPSPHTVAAYSTALKQNFLSRIHYFKKNKVSLLLQAKTNVCAQSNAVLQ